MAFGVNPVETLFYKNNFTNFFYKKIVKYT